VRVRLQGQLVRFSPTVTNRSLYDIAQVRFLQVKGLRIGDDCAHDYLCTPICTGAIVKNPGQNHSSEVPDRRP